MNMYRIKTVFKNEFVNFLQLFNLRKLLIYLNFVLNSTKIFIECNN